MEIIFYNTTDAEGGAAKSTLRLFNYFKNNPKDYPAGLKFQASKISLKNPLIIGPKNSLDRLIAAFFSFLDALPSFIFRNSTKWAPFSNGIFGLFKFKKNPNSSTIIHHLNWLNEGFLSIGELSKIKGPMVWVLHDCWPFTGGCHYPDECREFQNQCMKCPLLKSTPFSLSHFNWKRKKKLLFRKKNIHLVAPGNWIKDLCDKSSLYKNYQVTVIPNALDPNVFRPMDQIFSRKVFNFSLDKKLMLFGAVSAFKDNRKGGDLFLSAISEFFRENNPEEYEIILFGDAPVLEIGKMGVKVHALDVIRDEETLVILNSAVDIVCIPSRYESFGLTAIEALSAGKLVVCFNTSGLAEIIEHKKCGYLAEPFSTTDFKQGISWALDHAEILKDQVRESFLNRFSFEKVAPEYWNFLNRIVRDSER